MILTYNFSVRLEKLRVQLGREAYQHQVRFSGFHQRQLEVYSELFRRTSLTSRRFSEAFDARREGAPRATALALLAEAGGKDLEAYLEDNELFVSPDVAFGVRTVLVFIREMAFSITDDASPVELLSKFQGDLLAGTQELADQLRSEVRELLSP